MTTTRLLGSLALLLPLLALGCTTPEPEVGGRLAVEDHVSEPSEANELAELLRGVQLRNTDAAAALVDYGYVVRLLVLDPDRVLREGLPDLLTKLAHALETAPKADAAVLRTAAEIRALVAPPAADANAPAAAPPAVAPPAAAPQRPPVELAVRGLALAGKALAALSSGPYVESNVISARVVELDRMIAALEVRSRDLPPRELIPAFRRVLLTLQTMLLTATVTGEDLPAGKAAPPAAEAAPSADPAPR